MTALFGGTFDPVHIGHLMMADEVLARLGYECIRFVPARQPPHKNDAPTADGQARLEMLRLATEGRDEFLVDPYEIEQEGLSYTVRTLRHVVQEGLVTGRPGLIIGADLVAGFDRWREADEIGRLADIILVGRPGPDAPPFDRPHRSIENAMLAVSSTDVRRRAASGLPFRYLVPATVYDYICGRGLYGTAQAGRFGVGIQHA